MALPFPLGWRGQGLCLGFSEVGLKLLHGDCIEMMSGIPSGSVDMILCDLPYGVVNKGSEAGKWDSVIPFGPMWEGFLRVAKEDAAIVLFGQGMFTARLMMSNEGIWRYNLIWRKNSPTGFLNANRMPLREHEDIMVFYRRQPKFHQQMKPCGKDEVIHSRGRLRDDPTNNVYGKRVEVEAKIRCEKCPTSVLSFAKPHYKGQHPTEKPVDLLRWLIRSYTDSGETVMDATMGSGSCGVAAIEEGRGFIGIEKDDAWYAFADERISKSLKTERQSEFAI